MLVGNRCFLSIEQKTFNVIVEGIEQDVLRILENGRGSKLSSPSERRMWHVYWAVLKSSSGQAAVKLGTGVGEAVDTLCRWC